MGSVWARLVSITRKLPESRLTSPVIVPLTRFLVRQGIRTVEIDVLGFRMRLDPREFVDCVLLFFPQFYDSFELAYLAENLRPGDVFLDLGAYTGLYSLAASRCVGSEGIVLAVEPNRLSFEGLRYHLDRNDVVNVRALNIGVSDMRENRPLGVMPSGYRAASSFLFAVGQSVSVPCLSLTEILSENGIERFTGAKLDIEGFEYRVLKRFFDAASDHSSPDFFVVEYHPEWIRAAGGDVVELLLQHGYQARAMQALNYVFERAGSSVVPPLSGGGKTA